MSDRRLIGSGLAAAACTLAMLGGAIRRPGFPKGHGQMFVGGAGRTARLVQTVYVANYGATDRVTPINTALGRAGARPPSCWAPGGLAAALSLRAGRDLHELDIGLVQMELERQGVGSR